jgi:hypothetical protein
VHSLPVLSVVEITFEIKTIADAVITSRVRPIPKTELYIKNNYGERDIYLPLQSNN